MRSKHYGAYVFSRRKGGEPTGQFQGWWEHPVQDPVTGKYPRRTHLFYSKTAAEDWARTQRQGAEAESAAAGLTPREGNRRHTAFVPYAEQWLITCICAATTRNTRATRVRALVRHFEGCNLDDITPARVREVVAQMLQSGDSGDTVRGRVSVLKSIMAEAIADDLMTTNPVTRRLERSLPPSSRKTEPVRIRPDEFERVLKYVPDHLLLPAYLAYDCGLRAAEVAGLQWKRVDWIAGTILVTAVSENDRTLRPYTKGKAPRLIPVSDRTMALLKQHRGAPDEFIASRKGGGRCTPHNISSQWYKHVRKYSPELPAFHHLRHSLLVNLDETHADLRTIQGVAGHKNPATTQVYLATVAVERQREAMSRLHDRPHLRAV